MKGFTLIELMLAMSFMAFMFLAIAFLVIHIGSVYNRGITLRQINQSSRTIVEDVQRTVAASAPVDVSNNFIDESWGGRLCLGEYSYIWNTAASLDDTTLPRNVYASGSDTIRFVRVADSGGTYCSNPAQSVATTDAVELLVSEDRSLAIHSMKLDASEPNDITNQQLLTFRMVIGTDDSASIDIAGTACRPPSDSNADEYCAINEIVFTVRAGVR